ncbi:hypothetical protein X566_15860 [Afipia sp. P52-10]|nr:hypothetical protein X566_15860 [Afipia sp. P52-10]
MLQQMLHQHELRALDDKTRIFNQKRSILAAHLPPDILYLAA